MKAFIACALSAVLAAAIDRKGYVQSHSYAPRYPNYGRSSHTHHSHTHHRPHHDADEIKADILGAYRSVHDAHREPEPAAESSHDEAPVEEMAMEEAEEEKPSVIQDHMHSSAYLDKLKRQNPTAFVDFLKPESHIGDATTGEHIQTAHPEVHYDTEPKECHLCSAHEARIAQLEDELAYLRGARASVY